MNRTFKFFTMFIMIISLSVLAACGGSDSKDNASDEGGSEGPVKVGVISYLTGAGAGYGEAITNGINLAYEEIEEAGEVDIDLIIEDSAGEQEEALSAAQKLMSSDKVSALIGPTLSTEMNVVGPEADLNGVPTLGTSVTAEGIPQIGDYIFRNSIPETLAIPAAVEKAVEKNDAKKVAIIYGNDDVFTKAGYDVMKDVTEEMGLEVTTTETFQLGQSDYKAQLTKIKNTEPDLILASALYNEGAVILDQARKMGIDAPVVGSNGFNSPEIAKIAGEAANGLIVATPWFAEKDDEAVKTFVDKYTEEYGMGPDQFAAQAYDAMHMMSEAIKEAGSDDRDEIRDALLNLEGFEGILGEVSFDDEGDIIMDPTVLTIENEEYIEFE